MEPIRATVLGAGSWGTALATQLARQGHKTTIWDRNPERCDYINEHHRNPRYLKGEDLPESLYANPDLDDAVCDAQLLVPVLPSHALRQIVTAAADQIPADATICCATKGIEEESLKTAYEVLREVLPEQYHRSICLLYGPSFALEVTRNMPTAVACAGPDIPAHYAAEAFHGPTFRAYTTEDVIGVCIGGSLKNVIAIACGVSDGLGLGNNARAALITRGLAEITRLAVTMGANPVTMMGLAGMGDLVLTCSSSLSRNKRVGLGLGAGKSLNEILKELGEVAEGVTTAKTAHELALQVGVEMPITDEIYNLLYDGKPAVEAIRDLMGRDRRGERDDH